MIRQLETHGNLIAVQVEGQLTADDYEQFVPIVERAIDETGEVRLLVDFENFEGWQAGAVWEDLKFTVSHFRDVERIALVGDKRWHQVMAVLSKPFISGEVRFFDIDDRLPAWRWVREGMAAAVPQPVLRGQ